MKVDPPISVRFERKDGMLRAYANDELVGEMEDPGGKLVRRMKLGDDTWISLEPPESHGRRSGDPG